MNNMDYVTDTVRKAVTKGRRYVSDPSDAPEDVDVEEGPQGGYYYETEGPAAGEGTHGEGDPGRAGAEAGGNWEQFKPDDDDVPSMGTIDGEEVDIVDIDADAGTAVVEGEDGEERPTTIESVSPPPEAIQEGDTFEVGGEEATVLGVNEDNGVIGYETEGGEEDMTLAEQYTMEDYVENQGGDDSESPDSEPSPENEGEEDGSDDEEDDGYSIPDNPGPFEIDDYIDHEFEPDAFARTYREYDYSARGAAQDAAYQDAKEIVHNHFQRLAREGEIEEYDHSMVDTAANDYAHNVSVAVKRQWEERE